MDPNRPPDPNIRLTTVLRTRDAGLIALATSLLDEAGLDHLVQGGGLRAILGTAAGTFEVQVREEDADEARGLLEGMDIPPE